LGDEVAEIINDLMLATPKVLKDVEAMLPKGFPSEVAEPIFKGLEKSVDSIRAYVKGLACL
jgi:serine/threonine-protein kinase HipA